MKITVKRTGDSHSSDVIRDDQCELSERYGRANLGCCIKVWVFTVDNEYVKRYNSTEVICKFTPSRVR